jgi:hypothetical protein
MTLDEAIEALRRYHAGSREIDGPFDLIFEVLAAYDADDVRVAARRNSQGFLVGSPVRLSEARTNYVDDVIAAYDAEKAVHRQLIDKMATYDTLTERAELTAKVQRHGLAAQRTVCVLNIVKTRVGKFLPPRRQQQPVFDKPHLPTTLTRCYARR